ncbi:AraC family transcriptional regulator [Cohnella yongneupensis]|uniref:AraC family transcriptional regulator n=1 Tax=Cohnella yongneupensis TaxID=425006 RepID=A0ABW0R4P7_9BACL
MIPDHYILEHGFNAYRKPSELSLATSGYGRPMGGHKIGPAIHDYYLIHTVKSGRGQFICRGKRYNCSAGDTFYIFPGELFSYEADAKNPWEYLWASFNGRMAGELLRLIGVTPERAVTHRANEQIHAYYERTRETFQASEIPALVDLEGSAYLRLLLFELGKSNREHIVDDTSNQSDSEKRVKYAASLIKTQYSQALSIETLASSLGYHRVYFSNLFKQVMGKSPKQYLYDVRMEQAKLLLASTALTIEQIAGSVGYGDSLYFSKHYQRWSGLSPTAYRKATKLT